MKHLHGVAVENTHEYSLKSCIGKTRPVHMPRFGMIASPDLPTWLIIRVNQIVPYRTPKPPRVDNEVLHDIGIVRDLRTTVVADMLQPISASVILDVSEDEPDLASPAGLECAVDDCDITPVIGCKLLHE
jgi:hypothetical protein